MEFKSRPNIPHEIDGRIVWESRSVAVVATIFLFKGDMGYVLMSKRGPNTPDFQGKMNLVAGYLDWDETGYDAVLRESWEETGFDIVKFKKIFEVINDNLYEPWSVNTNPTTNRQNVTLRYGVCFGLSETDELPELTTEHNEVDGESENPQWLPLTDIDKYEWAFDHKNVINSYIVYLIQNPKK